MTARVRLIAASLLGVLGLFTSVLLISTPAQAAAKSTDLAISLGNKPNSAGTAAGKKITYTVIVRNVGSHTAKRVRIVFKTSTGLRKLTYRISSGSCSRSPKKTTCTFGTIRAGHSARVALTGVLSKKLKKGAPITNSASVTSSTKLINTGDDRVSDNFRLATAPVVATPAPTASSSNKIQKFSSATGKVFDLSRSVVMVTWVVLGAAVLWFIIGLTWRHVSRSRRGIYHDY